MRGACVVLLGTLFGCGGGDGATDAGGGDGGGTGGDGGGSAQVDAAPPAECGDGIRVRGEECDDSNTTDGDGCSATCIVEPYAGAPASAVEALHAMNAIRARADLPGAQLTASIVQAAQAHATYYATNAGLYTNNFNPHLEDNSYPNGFTGVSFGNRMSAAGFSGSPMYENMAFAANPTSAVTQWLNTVFHRIPLIHPNMTQAGYGNSTANGRNNDVMDYARGAAERPTAVTVWPPPGATGVPRQFNRTQEGPMPPTPPGGGNITGPIVSVMFATGQSGTLTSHSIEDSTGTALPITTIAPNDAQFGAFMTGSYAFYAAGPATAGATFTVRIAGTVGGQPFSTSWSFTTQ